MVKVDDALELLLPGADERLARRARDTVQFLRLLVADARGEPASRVGVDFERARGDLELGARRELRAALVELLRGHLAQAAGPDTFAWFGAPRAELQSCWATVLENRAESGWLASVPAPGESALGVAERLLASAERLEPGHPEWALWRARLVRLREGPRAAEEEFRRGLAAASEAVAPSAALLSAWIAGLCECLLDRGAAREARALLLEQRDRVASDARLCQLLGWSKLLLGDLAGARALLGGRRGCDAPLPGALHALRARLPEWVALLPQRFVEPAAAPATPLARPDRNEIGASVCVQFEIGAGEALAARRSDVAAGLRAGLAAWLAEQSFAPHAAGSLQQRLVLEQRVQVEHRTSERALAGALGREQTLALALVPLASPEGRLAGWLHLEFEHHLVPREERLAAFARAVAARPARPAEAGTPRASDPLGCEEAELFGGLVEGLGLRGPQRRWWGFRVSEGNARLVAEGADCSAPAPDLPGEGALLGRVLLAGGRLGFAAPDPQLALRAASACGIGLPLRWNGRVAGILVVESSRRGDLSPRIGAEHEEALETAALRLRWSAFRERHRETNGVEPCFALDSADFRAFCRRLYRAAESDCNVLVAGPAGAGKSVLAHWLHHESARASEAWHVCSAAALGAEGAWREALERASGGTLCLESVERLDPAAEERLLRWLDSQRTDPDLARRPRLIATATRSATCAGSALVRRLDPIRFDVPPLCARRAEIPALVRRLLARLAREEGLRAPELEDEAQALLWRQEWEGNLRELEGMLQRALLFAPGPVLTRAALEGLAARFGQKLVRRLPSRHPRRSDLVAALRTTRLGTGRINKTRAAAYLGWDPDTLVARLEDLGIDPGIPPDEGPWDAPPVAEPPVAPSESALTEPHAEG